MQNIYEYTTGTGDEEIERDLEGEEALTVERETPVVGSESERGCTTEQKQRNCAYITVETSFTGAKPPIHLDSAVQYQEIDIRATHVCL